MVLLIGPRLVCGAIGAARGAKRLAVLPSWPLPAFAEHRVFADAAARVRCDTREDTAREGIRVGASASTTGEGVVGLGQAPPRAWRRERAQRRPSMLALEVARALGCLIPAPFLRLLRCSPGASIPHTTVYNHIARALRKEELSRLSLPDAEHPRTGTARFSAARDQLRPDASRARAWPAA